MPNTYLLPTLPTQTAHRRAVLCLWRGVTPKPGHLDAPARAAFTAISIIKPLLINNLRAFGACQIRGWCLVCIPAKPSTPNKEANDGC